MEGIRPILGQWASRGFNNSISCLLIHLGVDYEDKIYTCGPAPTFDKSEWLNEKENLGLLFPDLPYWIDGNIKVTESIVILRQICNKYRPEYLGRNLREIGHTDMFACELNSQFTKLLRIGYEPVEEHQGAKNDAQEFLAKFMDYRGDKPFAIGQDPTYVDFLAYEYVSRALAFEPSLNEMEEVLKYNAIFEELPGVAQANAQAAKRPWNNPRAQWGASI